MIKALTQARLSEFATRLKIPFERTVRVGAATSVGSKRYRPLGRVKAALFSLAQNLS